MVRPYFTLGPTSDGQVTFPLYNDDRTPSLMDDVIVAGSGPLETGDGHLF